MKVLIVDDQADLGTMLKNLLANKKYEDTKFVLSGKSALEALKSDSYNLVICDYDMPEMNGHDVFQAMCTEGYECPFLLYTNADLSSLPKFDGASFIGAVNKKELPKLFEHLKKVSEAM
jgi:DNA-binding NtrC family response regulator